MNDIAILGTGVAASFVAFGIWLFYTVRRINENDRQWEIERQEQKRLKKLKKQAEHEAILSIKTSLERLSSRHNTSNT